MDMAVTPMALTTSANGLSGKVMRQVGSLPPACTAHLDRPSDVAGFRRAARTLFAHGIAPDQVRWQVGGGDAGSLFTAAPSDDPGTATELTGTAGGPAPTVPGAFVDLVAAAALHDDPGRFDLLYRLLWRLQHEPGLRHDPLDAEWMRAAHLAQAVRRDEHKMRAYVRFRPLARGPGEAPLHVAWFEPAHHIVEAAAPFFARRFTSLHWSILTPRRSVCWDGERLHLGDGARREDAPPQDAGDALWLTYYAHIFNPARLNLEVMTREMPRRYWKNLPEAALIQPLAALAHERSTRMIDQPPTAPARKLPRVSPPLATTPAFAAPPRLGAVPHDQRPAAWHATRDAARACTNCPLHSHATQAVFGEGPLDAQLMFVGEQPGDQEDLRGRPFVGPAGQLFDAALSELGLDRARAYVTNAVKHFKFELRGQRRLHKTAAQLEAAACLDWLEREIDIVRPRAIVALGATAARSLLGRAVAVTRERGQWWPRHDGVPVLVTLHPSALLRLPKPERDAAYPQWLADLALAARLPTDTANA